jgi:hypothetical protein
MRKNILSSSFVVLLSLKSWASSDLPVEQTIDPPPDAAPIDSFLLIALIIAVVFAGYYLNGRAKSLLNSK